MPPRDLEDDTEEESEEEDTEDLNNEQLRRKRIREEERGKLFLLVATKSIVYLFESGAGDKRSWKLTRELTVSRESSRICRLHRLMYEFIAITGSVYTSFCSARPISRTITAFYPISLYRFAPFVSSLLLCPSERALPFLPVSPPRHDTSHRPNPTLFLRRPRTPTPLTPFTLPLSRSNQISLQFCPLHHFFS